MKTKLYALCLVVGLTHSYAQRSLSVKLGTDIGADSKLYRFSQKGRVLNDGYYGKLGWDQSYGVKLQYQPNRYFGVEVSTLCTQMFFSVYDTQFLSDHQLPIFNSHHQGEKDLESGYLGTTKVYFTPQLSLYGYLPLNRAKTLTLYLSGAISQNFLMPNNKVYKTYDTLSENLTLKGSYAKSMTGSYVETGLKIGKKVEFYIGYKWYFAPTMAQADYTRVQQGSLVSTDHVSVSGGYQAVTMWLGYHFWENDPEKTRHGRSRKHKKHKAPHSYQKLPTSKPKPTVDKVVKKEIQQPQQDSLSVKKDTVKAIQQVAHIEKDTVLPTLAGREVHVTDSLRLHTTQVSLMIWDREAMDGDVVSLNLNGVWILENYVLQLKKKKLDIVLKKGKNYLTLHAVNEGNKPPCTASVLVTGQGLSKMITFSSDQTTSSTLEIVVE